MAIYVGMLRLARLCARSPGVLGTRAVLARGWQEARLQGVRPLRYAGPGRRGWPWPPGREFGGAPAELPWGPIPLWLAGWQAGGCHTSGWPALGSRYPAPST